MGAAFMIAMGVAYYLDYKHVGSDHFIFISCLVTLADKFLELRLLYKILEKDDIYMALMLAATMAVATVVNLVVTWWLLNYCYL